MRILRTAVVVLLAWLVVAPAVTAQDQPPRRERANPEPRAEPRADPQGVLRLLPGDVTTTKTVTVAGRSLTYKATAGTLPIYDQNGDRAAAVFYTAYVAEDANRPITFVFNGGPGAASTFLNFGVAGPRLAKFGPDGYDGAAAKLIDNPDTWLAFTDLVMIDPVGTGWSRTAKADDRSFWNVQRDADSVAKVIALYVAHNSRGASPKYLLGESYGGFRAAKVARALQSDQGIVVSGIIMVSPLLEASYTFGARSDALTAALQFPSLAATELERTQKFTPDAMAEAERFATTEYLSTLAGPMPTGDAARAFYGRIAQMTGLPVDEVAKARGYVRSLYMKHLSDQGVLVSSYDASFAVPDPFPGGGIYRGGDLMLEGFVRALSGLFVGYARDELGFKTDLTYYLLNRSINWDWKNERQQIGVSGDISALLTLNPSFRLLVVHGRSDLITSYGVARYLLYQLTPVNTPERVQFSAYRGGHMFYFDDTSRRAFTDEAKAFYQTTP